MSFFTSSVLAKIFRNNQPAIVHDRFTSERRCAEPVRKVLSRRCHCRCRPPPGHAVHLAKAAGTPEHVGLGTDLDGGFGAKYAAMSDLSELKTLQGLLRRHFRATQVEGILGTNWLAFLARTLPE